jgi:hypothetical protein
MYFIRDYSWLINKILFCIPDHLPNYYVSILYLATNNTNEHECILFVTIRVIRG